MPRHILFPILASEVGDGFGALRWCSSVGCSHWNRRLGSDGQGRRRKARWIVALASSTRPLGNRDLEGVLASECSDSVYYNRRLRTVIIDLIVEEAMPYRVLVFVD